ncbi:hypothetical protein ACU10_16960 [Xanthomonas oryzae pv. oryzicola]|nr:hypothetical protein ACU10_16960 [Xanthomonas oryzae pv. oryzicola]
MGGPALHLAMAALQHGVVGGQVEEGVDLDRLAIGHPHDPCVAIAITAAIAQRGRGFPLHDDVLAIGPDALLHRPQWRGQPLGERPHRGVDQRVATTQGAGARA